MEADYIVVGAGSAGCATARRLAESGASVIVIEAGTKDNIIPEVARLSGTIRAVSEASRKAVHDGLQQLADGAEIPLGAQPAIGQELIQALAHDDHQAGGSGRGNQAQCHHDGC